MKKLSAHATDVLALARLHAPEHVREHQLQAGVLDAVPHAAVSVPGHRHQADAKVVVQHAAAVAPERLKTVVTHARKHAVKDVRMRVTRLAKTLATILAILHAPPHVIAFAMVLARVVACQVAAHLLVCSRAIRAVTVPAAHYASRHVKACASLPVKDTALE